MRGFIVGGLLLAIVALGCGAQQKGQYDGPKVDKFIGKVVHDGKPVTFRDDEGAQLRLFHETGVGMGIPLKTDGRFEIGWMLIGKYSVMLERSPANKKGPSMTKHAVPGGLTIEEGKTEYEVELGKGYKP